MSDRPETLAEWALWYVHNGYAPVPVIPRTKRTHVKWNHGDLPEVTEEHVASWWGQWPDASIALLGGKRSGGCISIDCDEHHEDGRDESGLRTLHEWEKEHGELPKTLSFISGSGGTQYLYRTDREIRNSTDNTTGRRISVDIRGEGGLFVVPPSIHKSGRRYEWEEWPWDMEPAQADENVLAFIEYVQRESKADTQSTDDADGGHNAFDLPDKIGKGSRHSTLVRYAASLRAKGYHDDVLALCVRDAARNRCVPPYPDDETQAIIDYYCAKGPGHDGEGTFVGEDVTELVNAPMLKNGGLRKYHINDKELSRLFAHACGHVLRYVPENKCFYYYNGSYWQKDGSEQAAEQLVKQFVTKVQMLVTATIEDEDEKTAAQKLAAAYNRHTNRANLLRDTKSELVTHASEFDRDPMLLNVRNVTIDFRNGRIHSHRPTDMITQEAPVTYDPSARCDLLLKTLRECIEGDVDLERYVQKVFGLVVSGDTSRRYVAFVGTANNSGKNTVFGTLRVMLGSEYSYGYGLQTDQLTFAKRSRNTDGRSPSPDRAAFAKKRLILASETDEEIRLDCQFVKNCSGGTNEQINARFLNENGGPFNLAGIVVMLCNRYPDIDDATLFTSGRIAAIPFDRFLDANECDPTLQTRLQSPTELSGLLNWCIEGFKLLTSDGFERPDAVLAKTAEMAQTSDEVGRFVADGMERDDNAYTTAKDAHNAFKLWGGRLDYGPFKARLKNYMPVIEGRSSVNGGERRRGVIRGWRISLDV